MHGCFDSQRHRLPDRQPRERHFNIISQAIGIQRVACLGTSPMTDREAIRRLSLNSADCSAVTWLHFNHNEAIHAIVTHVFGDGPLAEKAEYDLMQRIAALASSYNREEDLEKWLLKCAVSACSLLREELNQKTATAH